MSIHASGAATARHFNPANDTHYALSESAQLELKMLFDAMEAIWQVMDTPPGELGAEIQPDHIAPIFATFARHGQRIMAEMPTRFPRQPGRKSA